MSLGPNFDVTLAFWLPSGAVSTRTRFAERWSRTGKSRMADGERRSGGGTRHGRFDGSHSSSVHVGNESSVKPQNSLAVPVAVRRRSQTRMRGGSVKLNAKTLLKPPRLSAR